MLTVSLKDHQYEIIVKKGCLEEAGDFLAKIWQPQRVAIITDDRVAPLYEEKVRQAVTTAGFEVVTHVVPEGEASKSLAEAEKIYAFLAESGFTRSDGVIALGGGVIGDLAAFAASTYMRGIHFIQIPTTLLAQVDSSIGGKTAVNTSNAKNLVGTFSQPDRVLIDTDVLETLEIRRVREGIAEIIKSAAIADLALWHYLENLKDETDLLAHAQYVIIETLKVKQKVVEEDEFDNGNRLILNFGHTIGHAIEKTAGYGVVSHGEGVALGMLAINQHAEKQGLTPAGSTLALKAMIEKFHLPTSTEQWDEVALFEAITHDKKARGNNLKLILLETIGKAKIHTVPIEELKNYLHKEAL
ncbi:3-dehydroquinate synthase [Enterococcus asini]|uniref:3-dehydroquinate synthase n=1 Tax=Enterococcus asini TaxID=57732 RepID=UPI00289242A3|nr:3-dehydroquinate synthase [Enterococcus asini]MDT2757891.1 3-dehydroquinate synthase [Enterococcus asini]